MLRLILLVLSVLDLLVRERTVAGGMGLVVNERRFLIGVLVLARVQV